MYNLLTTELRQITNSALGDSVQPSFNRTGGMMVFQSTAPLTGFPNPAGVPQVFVVKLNFVGNPQLPGPIFKQLSVGPSPANVIGLGPSINPILNENGTGIAFQSRSDFLGGGRDTGIYQIYYVDFDKDTFNVRTLFRITNGNASSEHPHLGFTKVPNPQPGADNKRKVLLFDSAATNLPGAQPGDPARKIYEVAISGLSDDNGTPDQSCVNGQPNTACVHNITTGVFGNCTHPVVDPSGSRLAFTCDGDPLRNGSTGNQAFALTRQNSQLYQITGAGEVVGPISNSIGQWFLTLATTSDLSQGGSCGTQLYIIDFAAGKWVAATGLGQLPPDAIPQGPTSRIGQRNFSILPAGAAAGGSDTAVTTRDGTTTTPVATTKSPIDQGNISMIIGAPDPFLFETTMEILQNRIKLPPIRTPFGAVCVTPTDKGVGDLDCDGGKEGGDYVITKDHFTDDSDPLCEQGCRESIMCPDSYVAPWQYVTLCPFCDFPDPTTPGLPPPDTGTCSGGPNAGILCRSDDACRIGLTCTNDLMSQWACQGARTVDAQGTFLPGGARMNFPVRLTLSGAAGPDREFCSGDDTYINMPPIDTRLFLTTGSATGTITDADLAPDPTTRALTLGTTVTITQTGAPFDCARLRTGDLAGAALVGVLPIMNVPNLPGFRDVVLSLHYTPDVGALASCDPFCLDSSTCDDGNPCNGVESCNGNRCAAGTPVVCDDGVACNGVEVCDPANGSCGPGTPLVCNDNNVCTGTDAAGTDACVEPTGCVFTPRIGATCDDLDACTANDLCVADPTAVAACHGTITAAALACDDHQLCNGVESCNPASGTCQTTPTSCDDTNTCTTDTCDPAANAGAGGCVNTTLAAGTPCNDGNACTGPGVSDTCNAAGQCTGAPVVCTDGNACNGLELCDSTLGCQPGTQLDCDDNNPCTTNDCDPTQGCVNAPLNGMVCDDGSACTVNDVCTPSGSSSVCTGALMTCDDGNACNGTETCNPGASSPATACVPGTTPTCEDNDICTTDNCVAPTGCVHTPTAACDDGNACNGPESCDPANPTQCLPPGPVTCDDGNDCTDDSCNPGVGCQHDNNTGPCSDGTECTTGDICSGGSCVGTPMQCTDNNACNGIETCDPNLGCMAGTIPNCNDGDECTTDSCDPVSGCQNGSDPESYAICRLNILADAIQGTPANDLGGVKKKKKYMLQVTSSLRALQKALVASPRQKAQNLRKSQRRLSRVNDGIQKAIDTHQIDTALGNQILDLVAKAARALQAIGK